MSQQQQPTNKRMALKWAARCKVPTCLQPNLAKGTIAYYAAGAGYRGNDAWRCVHCGPHPELAMPSRFRRTKGEVADEKAGLSIGSAHRAWVPGQGHVAAATTTFTPMTLEEAHKLNAALANPLFASSTLQQTLVTVAGALDNIEARLKSLEETPKVNTQAVEEAVAKAMAGQTAPLVLDVTRVGQADPVRIEGAHCQLPEVLERLAAGFHNVWLTGPAGTGKTTIVEHAAKALSLGYGALSFSEGFEEWWLLGRQTIKNGTVEFESTPFLRWYEEGGLFALEELDSANPSALIVLNQALANSSFVNPVSGKVYRRAAQAFAVVTANTFGTGGDAQYVGRAQLDASTLDRFVGATISIGYDEGMEQRLATTIAPSGGLAWHQRITTIRRRVLEGKARRIVSTRSVIAGARLVAAGWSIEKAVGAVTMGWTRDEYQRLTAD